MIQGHVLGIGYSYLCEYFLEHGHTHRGGEGMWQVM